MLHHTGDRPHAAKVLRKEARPGVDVLTTCEIPSSIQRTNNPEML